MKRLTYILTILWLGIFSSQVVYAATNDCPKDSIIGRSQNGTCTYLERYNYDDAGRTTLSEKWRMNDDSVLIGSSKTTTEYYPDGKTKEIASWKWSSDKNDWIGTTKYEYLYYDNGAQKEYSEYHWSTELDGWANYTRTTYEYNSKNKLILTTTYIGDGETWIPQTKKEQDYDTNNKTILERYWSDYDASTSTWIGSLWKVWEYKSTTYPSSPSLYEEYTWANNGWSGKTKYDAEYDSNGRYILKRNYSNYNSTTSTWEYSSEYHYKYDQWSNNTLSENYSWNIDHWVGISKMEYEFSGYNKQISKATYSWDDTNRTWIGVSKVKTLYDDAENLILDEQYNWSGNDWVGTKKEEYAYNTDKLILSTIAYSWDVTKAQWGNSTKVLADYDSHKNQIKDERYQWTTDAALAESGYWKGTKYETTTYNDKNVETDKITYQWDDTNHRWLGNNKSIYEFDAANHLILEEQYTWSLDPSIPEGGEWHGTKKEEFGYNAANLQTKAITYAWSDAINDWIGQTKKLSNFDSYKNQILNEQYTWVVEVTSTGGYWKGTEKEEYTYNSNKQQTSSLIYAWDDSARDWTYVTKTKATYDSYKNMTLDERYEWQNGEWVGTLKNEYAYNAKGQQIMFAYYAWDADAKTFIGMVKEEDEQDSEGRTIMHAEYTWGTTTWKGKSKDTYTYLSGDTQSSHISYSWKSNKWVENKKTEWTYTESGNVATETLSNWNSAWVYDTKTENTYTEDVLTAYIKSKWESSAWVYETKWEQIDQNTDRSYEWWNSAWSITQENKKTYDGENRLILESKQNWQQGVQTEGSKSVYQYTGNNLTLQSDSVYSNALSQWQETKRVVNTFDGADRQTLAMTLVFENGSRTSGDSTTTVYNGQNVEEVAYIWADNRWQGETKYEKVYASELNVTITESKWMDNDWFGVSKKSYEYYASGEEKSIIDYNFQITTSTWVYDTKVEYEYSGTKNIVTANYKWQNSAWVGLTKDGVYYDEGEDLTTATWEWKNGAWIGKTKLGESHDSNGNLVGQTTYSWKNGEFVYNKKTEVEYTSTNTKDKITATYTWNTATNAWHGDSKSGVTYASNGKIATQTTYIWLSEFDWQYNQLTENTYGSGKDLTTAIYTWNTTTNTWQGVSKSGETYAANGKISSQFSYVWGDTCWLNVKKTEWEYGEGKNNAVATYRGVDTAWVGVQKYSEVYTSTGDSLGFYTYCWKNNAWSDSLKTEYTYYENGEKEYYIQAKMANGVWSYMATSKWWELEYDADGRIILDAHYTWKTNRKRWYGDSKTIYQYDETGNVVYLEQDQWGGTEWIGKSKYIWKYNVANKQTLNEMWSWNSSSEKWVGASKREYGYYHDTIQNMTAIYSWYSSKNDWKGTSKSETLYDEYGNQTAFCQYTWSNSLWKWIGLYKYETIYDSKGRVIEQTTSRYDTDWYYDTKTQYTFDDKHGQVEKKEYTYNDGELVLTYHEKKEYDSDANGKIRTYLEASWETSSKVTSYEYTSYYYACDPKFQVEVKASPEDGGSVAGGGEFILNGQAVITAVPDSGCYTFKHWIDQDSSVVSTAPRYTFLVNKTNTYTAVFEPVLRTIRASVSGTGGKVSVAIKPDEYRE